MIVAVFAILLSLFISLASLALHVQTKISDLSQADEAAQTHAETFCENYNTIFLLNNKLNLLRKQCPLLLKTAPQSLPPLRAQAQALAKIQDFHHIKIQSRILAIRAQGQLAYKTLNRQPRDLCLFPGPLQAQGSSHVELLNFYNSKAGFRIESKSRPLTHTQVFWSYTHPELWRL